MLLALRILLGIGESVTYPCNSALLAQRAPVHARGQANGLIAAGQALGPVFGTLVGGLVMATLGWRAAFVAFGLQWKPAALVLAASVAFASRCRTRSAGEVTV